VQMEGDTEELDLLSPSSRLYPQDVGGASRYTKFSQDPLGSLGSHDEQTT
jgi:hypothetical protein